MNVSILPEFALIFMLVFARVGTMLMLMPGLGERVAPARIRVTLAMFITLLSIPIVRPVLPIAGISLPQAVPLLLTEMLIGFTFGLCARFLMSTLQTAGLLISQQIGLSFTMSIDPTGGDRGQSAAIGSFLSLLGLSLIFATNLHHVAIAGIIDSYGTIRPGSAPPSGDAADLAITVASSAFVTAVQISAPFLVFGLVFNVGLGILSRLMPQLQIFFLAMPAMILLGAIIFIFVIGLMMDGFLAHVMRVY
ncbi:MAG: flagellar biosynthetic protein FliR, partial [Rhabdaerophilum sp.]